MAQVGLNRLDNSPSTRKAAPTLDVYRALHDQVFVPIFTSDDHDGREFAYACVEAGCKVVEITLRRSDAAELIEWFLKTFPDRFLLIGSTLDEDRFVHNMRRRFPQLRTLDELVEMGVHGLVSMIGWSEEAIAKHSPKRLVIPTSMTLREAYRQTAAGAHFVKALGTEELEFVRLLRGEGGFLVPPIMVTGGMSLARIPLALEAGAMVVGAGFEILMGPKYTTAKAADVVSSIQEALAVSRQVRAARWPQIASKASCEDWLESLPHYHPFTLVE